MTMPPRLPLFGLLTVRSIAIVSLCLLWPCGHSARSQDPISFNRDVRPILSEHCFQCHGPDEQQRQGGIRIDRFELATAVGDSGRPAIVPGHAEESELWRRVLSEDPDEQMPPPSFGKPLRPEQRNVLQRWIQQGAEYQGHWAFLRVERPAVPSLESSGSNDDVRYPNPIDRFLLKRLQADGFAFAPRASREMLLRRVSLDLIGVPPTPEELDAFLNDPSPAAYENVVDRLMTSPHYGERMALPWLDLARYADSNGYQIDSSRQQWPWRDWVIDALNSNMPYDQFTIEQLAGDLLPNASLSQKVATGFNRNHRLNGEGGIIAEEWRVETVIDRVETTGLTWMALTLNCCRCHDHKYDPISQREFYSLFSYFNNIAESGTLQGESRNTEPIAQVPSPRQQSEWETMGAQIREAESALVALESQLPALVAAWEPGFRAQIAAETPAWITLDVDSAKARSQAILTEQSDGSFLVSGENPSHDVYEITAALPPGAWTGVLLECFPDASLPQQSVGRYPNGNFVLSRLEAQVVAPEWEAPRSAIFTHAEADYSQKGWEIEHAVKGNAAKGWAVDGPTRKEASRAIFLTDAATQVPRDAKITIRLVQETLGQHNIGRFRLSVTGLPKGSVSFDGARVSDSLRTVLALPAGERNDAQRKELFDFYRAFANGPWKEAESSLQKLRSQQEEASRGWPSVMVMQEIDKPRDAFVLIRGEYDHRGEGVTAALPKIFPPLPDGEPNNRLGLARWIAHRDHPLTARVWVNRAWEHFMGLGLVKTTENFGSQSEWPSHPELLDWLASEFMQPTHVSQVGSTPVHAWDMKALHKLIVMSEAYQQTSSRQGKEALVELDPENRLLGRGPRFRLTGEIVRDQALFVSGLLSNKIGGPSARPYMPDGVWDETSVYGDLRNYRHDREEGLYRRSLYTVWKRTAAPPSMLLFDAPNREICIVSRSRTNTPLQALSLLNEVTFVEAARKLGDRMQQHPSPVLDDKLRYGFRCVTSREPQPAELAVLVAAWHEDRNYFSAHVEQANLLLRHGESISSSENAVESVAFMLTGNVLLNLDECITRE
jgi:hypothetical protein